MQFNTYILGGAGTGKTTLITRNILAAIKDNAGVFFLDPNGAATDELLHHIPRRRRSDVILFDPSREEVLPFNPLEDTSNIPLSVSILIDTIKDAWGYSATATPTLDMYLYFSLSALAEAGQTLIGLPYLLTNQAYRERVLKDISDKVVKDFWAVFETMSPKDKRAEVSSTLNKALMLIADPRVRRTLALHRSHFSCAEVLEGKILFARLPQGQLSLSRTKLLGSVLLSLMHQAGLGRSATVPFHYYLDDAELWAPSVLAKLVSTAARYGASVTLAHQNIDQLPRETYAAVSANCAQQIVFRTSMEDAAQLDARLGLVSKNGTKFGFDELPHFIARQHPFNEVTPDLKISPIATASFPRSFEDIVANHRINLWVSGDVAERAIVAQIGG